MKKTLSSALIAALAALALAGRFTAAEEAKTGQALQQLDKAAQELKVEKKDVPGLQDAGIRIGPIEIPFPRERDRGRRPPHHPHHPPHPPFPPPYPPQPYPPQPYPPAAQIPFTCTAMDRGWEEHFGGHVGQSWDFNAALQQACGECKRLHGRCNVSCAQRAYVCQVQAPNGMMVWGSPMPSQWDAERDAMNRCGYGCRPVQNGCQTQEYSPYQGECR